MRLHALALAGLASLLAPASHAADDEGHFSYQVGLATAWKPSYAGSDNYDVSARPVIGLRWGRFRLTSSQANLIEGPSDGSRAPGASVSLVESTRWSSGLALRYDKGRFASDDPRLAALPEVRSTLRARLYGRYALEGEADDQRAISAALSSDLLGRDGGVTLSVDLSRRVALSPTLRWTQGIGLGAADATYMRSHHGVPAASAPAAGLPAYNPGAGLTDVHVGTGLTWRVHPNWRLGGTVGLTYMLGPAATSPLTLQRSSVGLVLGLVYISSPD
ncbi:MipA/OmpV family protein [Ideonella alba]|uniref:MipA/OmpV family protein n=1 Tax=Ideonella alba TaxID=2824118 RepID=A0A940YCA4_9BURK|nr:MipA/OmpV family protein [Ideonella alba]MBQ0932020.1 MipA/OmpV family protein [Ideonella alba]